MIFLNNYLSFSHSLFLPLTQKETPWKYPSLSKNQSSINQSNQALQNCKWLNSQQVNIFDTFFLLDTCLDKFYVLMLY